MYFRFSNSWLKYIDFLIGDLLVLEAAYVISVMLRNGADVFTEKGIYRELTVILLLINVCVIIMSEDYKDILQRGYLKEVKATGLQAVYVMACEGLYLFMTKQSDNFSRISFFLSFIIYFFLLLALRYFLKWYHRKYGTRMDRDRAVLLLTTPAAAQSVAEHVKTCMDDHSQVVVGIALTENPGNVQTVDSYPVVVSGEKKILKYIQSQWVDEVLIRIPRKEAYPDELVKKLVEMGVTIHRCLSGPENVARNQIVEKVYGYPVLTTCFRTATARQAILKRLMDIVGALVGLVLTGLLTIVIGPLIYFQSPGPIFFSQERIGKNGKRFRLYKFRSMYMDAEKRKAGLMEKNQMKGFMFKMPADPRIIGSGPKGTRHGLGWFIRKTSIDEFPQFWNVLKGDMSLVGTRPPTVDEWEQYAVHHRARMAIKPGITGLWQVSGRNNITDFEEVVRLDLEYIQTWTLGEDIKILFRTVGAVLTGTGSE